MKINLKNGVATLQSENAAESKRMVDFYYGVKPETEAIKVKKTKHIAPDNTGKKYKRLCDICGKKFKNLKTHKKFKHELQGKVGWHATGIVPEGISNKNTKVDLLPSLDEIEYGTRTGSSR
ncbi:MAG: hypothetical protein V4436_02110 [Patescibacteria group bacterium]